MRSTIVGLSLVGILSLATPLRAQVPSPAATPAIGTAPAVDGARQPVASSTPAVAASTGEAASNVGPALAADPITVEPSFAGLESIHRDEPVELRLSRPLHKPDETRIAVILGTTDISGLFKIDETALHLVPGLTPLPSGTQDMVVFLCTSDRRWHEIARFPIRVLGRFGFERAALQPKLDLSLTGQVAEDHVPDEAAPPRATFQDLTMAGGMSSDHVRRGFSMRSQVNVVGASNEEQALQFAADGQDAPQFDLSNYLISVQQGSLLASIGHVQATGGNRHLMGSIASRGTSLAFKAGRRLDVALSAISGTSVVGFDNLFGLQNEDHRILAGTLGIEVLPRAGALRLETTLLDARLLPQTNFNQGEVTDAETNRAVGFRLLGSLPSQRVRLEAGFTRSEFDNPDDPLLSQGFDVVPVEEETNDARYLDLNLDVLQGLRLGQRHTANVSLLLRHERVDPLFRAVSAQPGDNSPVTNAVTSDRLLNQIDLQAAVANVSFQGSYSRVEDNLDDISSILKTKTRRSFLSATVPIAQVFGSAERPSPFLPVLAYSIDRTHQFGDSTPVNGDFDEPSEVPDQVSTAQTGSADWRFSRFSLRYALTDSFQDNRQPDRQLADFSNLTNTWTVGVTPLATLTLNFDVALERTDNKELEDVSRTRRLGFNGSWTLFTNANFSVQASHTITENEAQTRENEAIQVNATGSWSVQIFKRVRAQLSIGANHSDNSSSDIEFGFKTDTRATTVNTGLSLSFF